MVNVLFVFDDKIAREALQGWSIKVVFFLIYDARLSGYRFLMKMLR